MGVDHTPKLIVGFQLDTEAIDNWLEEHDIEDPYEINEWLSENHKECGIHFSSYGNNYSDKKEYYLVFFDSDELDDGLTIKDLLKIDDKSLNNMKMVYQLLTGEELKCDTVHDIPVNVVLYVW
jgi:hypothetical protein